MIEHLAILINKFDTYYEMSDSRLKYESGLSDKLRIETKLKNLKPFEIDDLITRLNERGHLNFNRYFKNTKNEKICA